MLGGLFKKLFGGGGAPGGDEQGGKPLGEAVEYKGCSIQPIAMQKGSQYLTAGIITKVFADGPREHQFIRADTHSSADSAREFALVKGRQIVDERGDHLFDRPA